MIKKCLVVLAFVLTVTVMFSQDVSKEVFEDYLAFFLNGQYDKAYELQAEQLTALFGIASMKKTAESIISQYGRPQSVYSTDGIEQNGYKSYIRIMMTTKGYLKFTVTVDENDLIAGFYVAPVPDPRKNIAYVKKES